MTCVIGVDPGWVNLGLSLSVLDVESKTYTVCYTENVDMKMRKNASWKELYDTIDEVLVEKFFIDSFDEHTVVMIEHAGRLSTHLCVLTVLLYSVFKKYFRSVHTIQKRSVHRLLGMPAGGGHAYNKKICIDYVRNHMHMVVVDHVADALLIGLIGGVLECTRTPLKKAKKKIFDHYSFDHLPDTMAQYGSEPNQQCPFCMQYSAKIIEHSSRYAKPPGSNVQAVVCDKAIPGACNKLYISLTQPRDKIVEKLNQKYMEVWRQPKDFSTCQLPFSDRYAVNVGGGSPTFVPASTYAPPPPLPAPASVPPPAPSTATPWQIAAVDFHRLQQQVITLQEQMIKLQQNMIGMKRPREEEETDVEENEYDGLSDTSIEGRRKRKKCVEFE